MPPNNNFDAAVEELKAQYRNQAPDPNAPDPSAAPGAVPGTDPKNIPQGLDISPDDAERLFAQLIEYPYDLLNQANKTTAFSLSPTEKGINGLLIKMTVLYYLPFFDLGKWSLWIFLAFNGFLVWAKYSSFKDQVKGERQTSPTAGGEKPSEKSAESPAPNNTGGTVQDKPVPQMGGVISQAPKIGMT